MLFFQVPFSACVHHLSLVEFDLRFVVKHGLCVLAEDGCTTTFCSVFCPCLALCLRFLLLTLLCCSLGVLVGTLSTFFFGMPLHAAVTSGEGQAFTLIGRYQL